MSTRDDARLTAQERAALANLEAVAAAEDPRLASRLRGAGRLKLVLRRVHLPGVPAWAHTRWWGVPMFVVGLVLVVLGISVTWVLGVVGALLAAGGLYLLVREAEHRWAKRTPPDQ